MPVQTSIYDSVLAARYLRALAFEKGEILNVTKLQKLMYIAYGYFLSKGRIIINEKPRAWPFGPVFPRVKNNIDFDKVENVNDHLFDNLKADTELTDFFKTLIDKYANLTASQLSEWSHMEGSPWYKATKQRGFSWNNEISTIDIKEYFSTIEV